MPQKDMQSQPAAAKIQYKGFSFLITDRPFDFNIYTYIEELTKHNVSAVVRVCEPTYNEEPLIKEKIAVYDLVYEDGMYPPSYVVEDWFKLLKKHFQKDADTCIAVHCVAGLGRAPVMVALTLIELGMIYEDAVELIREKKRGAINQKQLRFLEKYRPKSRLKKNCHKSLCCVQ